MSNITNQSNLPTSATDCTHSGRDSVTPAIMDFESSGLGAFSYPIEVGVALSDGSRHCMLIKPEDSWTHWDDSAESLHGISREALLEHGKPVQYVAKTLNELLQGTTVYCDGWVVDRPWLTSLFHMARMPVLFQLSPIEQLFSESQFSLWDSTKLKLIQELGGTRHRASHDAWIIQQTFMRSKGCGVTHDRIIDN